MFSRKPDSFVIGVALLSAIVVLGTFLVDIFLSQRRNLEDGRQRLEHFSQMLAEHTARSFEAIDILLRDTASDLTNNHRQWREWESSRGWEYLAQRHSRAMPQLRDLVLFDQEGNQLFMSTYYPTPHLNVREQPYFSSVAKGNELATYGPYVGGVSGRYTYGICRRVRDGNGGFSGAAFAAVEPAYFPDFCWGNRLSDDFEGMLLNSKGQIVASCRPTDLTRQASLIGSLAEDSLYNGQLKGAIQPLGTGTVNGVLISVTPVPGFSDLRVLAAIPESTLLTAWKKRAVEFGILATLVACILLYGSWRVRRQVRELADITAALEEHRKHLEERIEAATTELAEQKGEAERANAAKSRFLAAASHDLRQPLQALSLFAADLHNQVRHIGSEDLNKLAEHIATSTSVLGELLDSLLDVSRLDVAGVTTDIRPFQVQTIFDRLASSYRRAAQNKSLLLRFRPTRLSVTSDLALVERLLANLVSNAIRYTPQGRRVLVAARRRGAQVIIQVRDAGIGIAAEHQAAVFAEFYQVGNAARESNKGLGLGLAIVDRLARALDIPIELRSRLGAGTTFTITLPYAPEPPAPPKRPQQQSRVLFLGDSADIAAAAKLAHGWGFQTEHIMGRDIPPRGRQESHAIVVTEPDNVAGVLDALPTDCHLAVIGSRDEPVPPSVHQLAMPLRPAKLRALLEQLQKTTSKSMP